MIPQRSVPIASQNVTRFPRSTLHSLAVEACKTSSRRRSRRPASRSRRSGRVRDAVQPRSSIGSRKCASSLSSTTRTPSGPMMRLPSQKIAVHHGHFLDGPGSRSRGLRSAGSNTGRSHWRLRISRSRSTISFVALRLARLRSISQPAAVEISLIWAPAELTRRCSERAFHKLLIARDLARDRVALDALHEEPVPSSSACIGTCVGRRNKQAGVVRRVSSASPRHRGLLPVPATRRRLAARGADRADKTARDARVEQPGLLAGAAENCAALATPFAPASHAATQRRARPGSFALELGRTLFQGRANAFLEVFRRAGNACDSNSRLSWSSNEYPGCPGRVCGSATARWSGHWRDRARASSLHQTPLRHGRGSWAPFQRLLGRQTFAQQR